MIYLCHIFITPKYVVVFEWEEEKLILFYMYEIV